MEEPINLELDDQEEVEVGFGRLLKKLISSVSLYIFSLQVDDEYEDDDEEVSYQLARLLLYFSCKYTIHHTPYTRPSLMCRRPSLMCRRRTMMARKT